MMKLNIVNETTSQIYKLSLNNKFTYIVGDSATGKSRLVSIVQSILNGEKTYKCDKMLYNISTLVRDASLGVSVGEKNLYN